ncbi:MAG TPA: response regulator [Thermomonas sp.]|nr:response regulator [Thermomonas sp.]
MAASLSPGLAPSESPAAAPVNILLVDDQPGRLLTYRAILEPLGERLVEARSGNEALQKLMQEEFALILLDVNMPGMDGFETASMIHQHPRFEKTPIIFVTAVNVSDMDRIRGYKLGAVDYVMVPVIPDILRSKVEVLAELHRKRRELQDANEQLAAANDALRLEQARELNSLNESLRIANASLAERNRELQGEIGERSRAEEQLRQQDKRKDEFLATLAHELRNPLAPLRNAITIRRLGNNPDPLQAVMERQLALLVRLIDDLLDVSRINLDKLTLKRAPTTLQAVLEAALETSAPLMEAGDHALQRDIPALPLALEADFDRLSQVFSNLLSNAAKYSPPGLPVEVSVSTGDGRVRTEIRDHGIGLTPEQAEHVFELFNQVDTSIERSHGGLGIGLTLVRKLVEMHGGQVRVQSEGLGQGSCFTVDLPLGHALPVAKPASVASRLAPGTRALVLDDNRDAADTLALALQVFGLDVRALYEPLQAAEVVAAFDPDLVFLDIGMPGLNGYDLARELRRTHGERPRVLVAVTGWGQPEDLRRTAEAGFDHHLVKPPDLDRLREVCASVVPWGATR